MKTKDVIISLTFGASTELKNQFSVQITIKLSRLIEWRWVFFGGSGMNDLFSSDSKLYTIIAYASDLIALNLIFLLCCIPIFTIGSSQSALYRALRVLQNNEDDRSCVKIYFQSFCSDFWKINVVEFLYLCLSGCLFFGTFYLRSISNKAHIMWLFSSGCFFFALSCSSLLPIFHSSYDCTTFQLIKNSILLFFCYPLRAILICIITWFPVLFFCFNPELFASIVSYFFLFYFSVGLIFNQMLIRKPFQLISSKYQNQITNH